ncbi:MAG: hypothetical protein OHK0052_02860 [Anaerolineales bacterium]
MTPPHHTKTAVLARRLFLFITLLLLTACTAPTLTDFETRQEYNQQFITQAQDDATLGQTFVSQRDSLTAITLWLHVGDFAGADGDARFIEVTLTREDTDSPVTRLRLSPHNLPWGVTIPFTPQADSANQSYRVTLRSVGQPLYAYGRAEDTYPNGTALANGTPLPADLAFRLHYAYTVSSFWQDLRNTFSGYAHYAILLSALLFAPGWLLLRHSGLLPQDGGARLALALAVSMSLPPVLMAWTTALRLPLWTPVSVAVVYGLTTLFTLRRARLTRPSAAFLGLLGILLVSALIRFIMIRDLSAPAWVDSVHHTLLTRLILETGAYPQTYAPYVPNTPPYYHPGMHSLTAILGWLNNSLKVLSNTLHRDLLIFGQALNTLSALAIYLLTYSLTHKRTPAVFAALLTGIFSPMPAYYLSWGRYTQLAGLLILPAAFYFLQRSRRDTPHGRRALLLAALTLAGLFIVHYRVAVFCGVLYLASLRLPSPFGRTPSGVLREEEGRGDGEAGGLLAVPLAVLLALPWLLPTLQQLILPKAALTANVRPAWFDGFSEKFFTSGGGGVVLGLAMIGVGIGLWQQRRVTVTLLLWTGGLVILGNASTIGLPGPALLNFAAVQIALYQPLVIFGGIALAALWDIDHFSLWLCARDDVPSATKFWLYAGWHAAIIAALFAAAVWAMPRMLTLPNPGTIFFRDADAQAMNWIAHNTPPEASFLINTARWGYGMYVGSDGGYWIAPLAGRVTFPPNVLYGLGARQSIQAIHAQAAALLEVGSNPDGLAAFMRANSITHLYIGAAGGAFSPAALAQSTQFRVVYQQAGVWIFEVVP